MRLHYGVWDGVVYDNRGTADYKEPEGLDLKNLLQFNNGNPVMTFISHRGFLVFHPHANLLFAMNKYYSTVSKRQFLRQMYALQKRLYHYFSGPGKGPERGADQLGKSSRCCPHVEK